MLKTKTGRQRAAKICKRYKEIRPTVETDADAYCLLAKEFDRTEENIDQVVKKRGAYSEGVKLTCARDSP